MTVSYIQLDPVFSFCFKAYDMVCYGFGWLIVRFKVVVIKCDCTGNMCKFDVICKYCSKTAQQKKRDGWGGEKREREGKRDEDGERGGREGWGEERKERKEKRRGIG